MALVPQQPQAVATMFGQLVVRPSTRGAGYWLTVPTGSASNRLLMQTFCINEEEAQLAAMPSRDIEVLLPDNDPATVRHFFAKIIRRESYWRAMLIQSRGVQSRRCPQKCGNPNARPKFRHCVRLPGYQNGACAECVWQGHGSHCGHARQGDVSPGSSVGGSSHGGDDDGGDGGRGGRIPPAKRITSGSSGLGREVILVE